MDKLGLVLLAALSLVACKSSNGDFCDAEHPCTDPARPYCDLDGTYPASEGVAKTCIADPNGGGACDGDEDCTDPAFPACEAEVCHECHDAAQCTASAPVCDAGFTCAGCTAPADCAAYADTPICGASGACVECAEDTTCSGTTPVCNAAGSCEACTADAQCDSGICDETTGACVAEGMIAYVSTTGSGTGCSKATPCGTVQAGVDAGRPYVKVAEGSYAGGISVIETQAVTVVGPATLQPGGIGQVVVEVSDTATIAFEAVTISNTSAANAVQCSGSTAVARATVRLTSSVVTLNGGIGIDATRCDVLIARSSITTNSGGGVRASESRTLIRNSMIVGNGGGTTTMGGVQFSNPTADTAIEFSTLANNVGGLADFAGISCPVAGTPLAFNGVLVSGSGNQVPSTGSCSHFEYSNLPGGSPTGTNISMDPTYVNTASGNYHLAPGSAGIDMGGTTGLPEVDFDGELRPNGAAADIGADEVYP